MIPMVLGTARTGLVIIYSNMCAPCRCFTDLNRVAGNKRSRTLRILFVLKVSETPSSYCHQLGCDTSLLFSRQTRFICLYNNAYDDIDIRYIIHLYGQVVKLSLRSNNHAAHIPLRGKCFVTYFGDLMHLCRFLLAKVEMNETVVCVSCGGWWTSYRAATELMFWDN